MRKTEKGRQKQTPDKIYDMSFVIYHACRWGLGTAAAPSPRPRGRRAVAPARAGRSL